MNLNKVFIIGRVTSDPETRTTPSGQNVTSMGVATNRVWNDKNGQKQEQAEFHNIVAWGGLADICQKYLQKGQLVFFEGRLQTRSWQGQDGVKKYRTEIVAENMQLGPKSAGTGGQFAGSPSGSNRPSSYNSPKKNDAEEEIPVINEETPIDAPLSKGSANDEVETAEINLKDIPF